MGAKAFMSELVAAKDCGRGMQQLPTYKTVIKSHF